MRQAPEPAAAMIKLFSLKNQEKDGKAAPGAAAGKKTSAAQLRATKGASGRAPVVFSWQGGAARADKGGAHAS